MELGRGAGSDLWTEHVSRDGRVFWHNKQTGGSTWDKPDALKTDEERYLSSLSSWREHKTNSTSNPLPSMTDNPKTEAHTSSTFWYNADTKESMWETPEEILELKKRLQVSWDAPVTDKKEAANRFSDLLLQKISNPKAKWEEASKAISQDPRYENLKILTPGEKRQIFSEAISRLQKKSREMTRVQKRRAWEATQELLNNWKTDDVTLRVKDVVEKCKTVQWWSYLDEKEKQDLIKDFLDEIEKRYRETFRTESEKRHQELRSLYEETWGGVEPPKWSIVVKTLKEHPVFKTSDKLDGLNAWISYVYESDQKFKAKEKQKTYRHCRQQRDLFRQMLTESIKEESFTSLTEWKHWIQLYKDDPRFLGALGLSDSSSPRTMWEYERYLLLESNNKKVKSIKKLIKNKTIKFSTSTTFEEFKEELLNHGDELEGSMLDDAELQKTFEYLHCKKRKRSRRHHESANAGSEVEPGEVDSRDLKQSKDEKDQRKRRKHHEKSNRNRSRSKSRSYSRSQSSSQSKKSRSRSRTLYEIQ